MAELALIALLVAAYALLAARFDRVSIGPAMAFVAIGLVMSAELVGPISLEPESEAVKLLAEAALTLILFVDASSIRARALRRDRGLIARLLVVGLLTTIVLGTLGALALFPGVSVGIALLIGAALAPTDAALGQPVVTDPAVPTRIRRILNVESGLNDGIATPFVLLGLTMASAEGGEPSRWILDAFVASTIGLLVGVVTGVVGGLLLVRADRRGWTSAVSRQLFTLALAGACYLTATATGGNGFIAAFVGGLAFGVASHHEESSAIRFTEGLGSLLAIGVWTSFGLVLAGDLLRGLGSASTILYAVLSLTVFRMAPVALALFGTHFDPRSVLFVGWFGPRGLASIVFVILGLEGLHHARVDSGPLASVVAWTVLLSVILHGLTARPLAARYGRIASSLPVTAPELGDSREPVATRTEWARSGHDISPGHVGQPRG